MLSFDHNFVFLIFKKPVSLSISSVVDWWWDDKDYFLSGALFKCFTQFGNFYSGMGCWALKPLPVFNGAGTWTFPTVWWLQLKKHEQFSNMRNIKAQCCYTFWLREWYDGMGFVIVRESFNDVVLCWTTTDWAGMKCWTGFLLFHLVTVDCVVLNVSSHRLLVERRSNSRCEVTAVMRAVSLRSLGGAVQNVA